MGREKNYIKILDEKIAVALSEGGFPYMKEKINGNQEVYVFEMEDALFESINKIYGDKFFLGNASY